MISYTRRGVGLRCKFRAKACERGLVAPLGHIYVPSCGVRAHWPASDLELSPDPEFRQRMGYRSFESKCSGATVLTRERFSNGNCRTHWSHFVPTTAVREHDS